MRSFSQEMASLLRREGTLARAELRERLGRLGSAASEIGAGALVTFAGFLVLLESAVFGIAWILPLWLAALVVGATVFIVGLALLAWAQSDFEAERLAEGRPLPMAEAERAAERRQAARPQEQDVPHEQGAATH